MGGQSSAVMTAGVQRSMKRVQTFSTKSTQVDRNGDQIVFKLSTGVYKVTRPGQTAEFFDYLHEAHQAIGKGVQLREAA